MGDTSIEWTDRTWNPVRGCSRVSKGCESCYAERQAARFSDPGQYAHGFVKRTKSGPRWTGKVELVESKLAEPLSWRKPQRVFVNSMSDLFHESLQDEAIDRVFAVMALAHWHTFQVLTKRPRRMREYLDGRERTEQLCRQIMSMFPAVGMSVCFTWPLPNVWLGVSAEDQTTADERIPILLDTPAAVRFVSAEPLLGPVDLHPRPDPTLCIRCGLDVNSTHNHPDGYRTRGIDWVIVGGESGPGARPCDVAWIRLIVAQCKAAEVPVFVKQLGARPEFEWARWHLADRKGGDPSEWDEDLRVRQFPREAVRG